MYTHICRHCFRGLGVGRVPGYVFRGLKQVHTLRADDAAEGPGGVEAFQAALQLATQRGRTHPVVSESVSLEVLILEGAESLGPFLESNEKEDLDLRQAGFSAWSQF